MSRAPVRLQVDGIPSATAASGASDGVLLDAVGAAPVTSGEDAGKSAVPEPVFPASAACRSLGPSAAVAAVPPDESVLCKPVADPFAARSCAVAARSAAATLAVLDAEEPQLQVASALPEASQAARPYSPRAAALSSKLQVPSALRPPAFALAALLSQELAAAVQPQPAAAEAA